MKIFIIILLVVLCAFSFYLAYYFQQRAQGDQTSLYEERYLRMVSEENLQKAEQKITSLEETLTRKQEKIKDLSQGLTQQESLNVSLKSRLNELDNAKNALEAKIKELNERMADAVKAPSHDQMGQTE